MKTKVHSISTAALAIVMFMMLQGFGCESGGTPGEPSVQTTTVLVVPQLVSNDPCSFDNWYGYDVEISYHDAEGNEVYPDYSGSGITGAHTIQLPKSGDIYLQIRYESSTCSFCCTQSKQTKPVYKAVHKLIGKRPPNLYVKLSLSNCKDC